MSMSLVIVFVYVRIAGAILFLFVFINGVHITMASASQYDSRRHGDMAQTRQKFFISTL